MNADREKGGKKTTMKARVKVLAPLITLSALALVLVVAATVPLGLTSGGGQLSAYAYSDAETHLSSLVTDTDSHTISCPGPASANTHASSQGTCGSCRGTGVARSHAAGTPPNVVTNSRMRVDTWVRRGHNGWARAHATTEEDPVGKAVGASYTIEIDLEFGITLIARGQGTVKASIKITVKQGGQTKHYGETIFDASGVLTVNPSIPSGAGLLWTYGDWAKGADNAVFPPTSISRTVADAPAVYVRTEISAEVPSQDGSSDSGYAVASTERTVGGIWVPVDTLALLAPWIFLGVSVAAITVGTIYSRKRWLGKAAAPKP